MKKLYFSLLLIMHSSTSFCMEQKYPSNLTMGFVCEKSDGFTEIPLHDFSNDSTSSRAPIYSETKPSQQPSFYRQNSTQQNQELIQNLYSQARSLIRCHLKKGIRLTATSHLCQLINNLNETRKNNINEDILAQYAYKNQSIFNLVEPKITIFFGCLKRYHLTIKNTKEKPPFKRFTQKELDTLSQNHLKQALGIQNSDQQESIKANYAHLTAYPAYLTLIDSFDRIEFSPYSLLNTLASCLHSNIIFPPYPSTNWCADTLYNKTYKILFCSDGPLEADAICHLIHITETAKYKLLVDEKDLGYKLLNLEPTRYFLDFGTSCCQLNYCDAATKNRISLFFQLIANYNCKRHYKKTPHEQQYNCYKLITDTNLALPDSYTSNLFDEKIYAFKELSELIKTTKELIKVSDDCVEECVKSCYPNRIGQS